MCESRTEFRRRESKLEDLQDHPPPQSRDHDLRQKAELFLPQSELPR